MISDDLVDSTREVGVCVFDCVYARGYAPHLTAPSDGKNALSVRGGCDDLCGGVLSDWDDDWGDAACCVEAENPRTRACQYFSDDYRSCLYREWNAAFGLALGFYWAACDDGGGQYN